MKMDNRDDTAGDDSLSLANASPPDFDFNLPCRFFKSSFARSLSLNNASNSSQCKSLDYDKRANNTKNNNGISNKLSYTNRAIMSAVSAVPPLPQKRLSQAGLSYQQNEANTKSEQKQQAFTDDTATTNDEEKPPALPARRPPSLHNSSLPQNLLSVNECQMNAEQKFQQTILTQLRQQTYKQTTNHSNNNSVKTVANGKNNICGYNNNNNSNYIVDPATLNQKPQPHHFATSSFDKKAMNSSGGSNSNSCNSGSGVNNMNNLRRNINNDNSNNNHIVWPNQQKNVEQDCNICNYGQVHEDTDQKLSTANEYNKHFHNSHQMLHMIPAINIHSNQQQQQQQEQQHHHQQQQHHQTSSYEILNDSATNVEAVILQNQVDTLQWQLKQVETSCDMYRAVVEEVARFLERYQSQKQLQQQQKQQQQQQHHHHNQQMSTQKHFNSNNKLEQIPRSKSLFQVYIAGANEKNKNENNNNSLDDTSPSESYLRARSSTNLIDLKHQQLNASCGSKSKDDHIYETCLVPSQSYSAFKDFTWRRSPKKSDSRLNIAKDDLEEKLNQEAFRLLRTIHNLLNTSQHQPNLTHHHRQASQVASQGLLSKAMSSNSVLTLPGPPILNSTNSTNNGSSTPDSTNTSPTTATANNAVASAAVAAAAVASSSNLAPEMLFLRSANMRDSRLSLRSSTDSSVHSTSSAASSASSKVETDEEASPPFHSPPNVLTHKQQQQHHLTGSSTEDESGFSSISSFPDIGVPLSSTPLPSANTSNRNRFLGKEVKSLKSIDTDLQATDSRNSTLKANVVGLPLSSTQDITHRWDSPSKTYHNASNKFQKFSALTNEDSNTVLWV